ncbi:MAG: class I SAM-dependent methyltransferase [Tagaea sp.]|nr:class I SAM-dependent methyltransferase [Tagaea sp.]
MTTIPRHDLSLGRLHACQVCGSENLAPIVDLGHQPPCDSLLTPAQLDETEKAYPLRMLRCLDCGLAQIDFVVEPHVLFHPDYPYRSGITPTLARNLMGTGETIVDRFGLKPGALAIDIGSNDGTLLKGFKGKGLRVLGVEATNIAKIAEADGIPSLQAFFSEETAREILAKHGQAAAITATNMFAHVPNLGDLLRGVDRLLPEGGVFVTESHYLLDLIETVQYDSIYHEHLKYYAIGPLVRLFEYYGFTVVDAERIPNYGGSIRVYAVKGRNLAQASSIVALRAAEKAAGLEDEATYARFAARTLRAKLDLQSLLLDLKRKGTPAPGIGCPGRSSTLLNYSNIDPDLMPYIAEQSTSLKLGLHLPGKHIPIVDEKRLFDEQPPYAVILSWHYAQPIVRKLRERGLRSKIVVPLPELTVIET